MATKAKEDTKAKRPSRDELAEYFAREEQISALRRQANDLAKLQGETDDKVLEYVRQAGGDTRCAIVCGYRLSIELVAARVEWQKALMKELAEHIGTDQAQERAESIRKAAGTKEKAKIEPPS